MDKPIIKYTNEDTPYDLANKINELTGGYLPVNIAFEDPRLAKGILNNSKIKNLEEGIADKFEEGLILGGISPGKFKLLKDNSNKEDDKPYSIVLIYEKL
ncbi:MAG: hypothetical protein ACP5NZ_02810 [Nanobdellota archaeon]